MGREAPFEGELLFRLSPAPYVDGIAEDGEELLRHPQPYMFNGEGWLIGEDLWRGRASMIVGLTDDLHKQENHLLWEEAILDPEKMVGRYAITRSGDGKLFTVNTAIVEVQKAQFSNGEWALVGRYTQGGN